MFGWFHKKKTPKLNASYIRRKCGLSSIVFGSVTSTNGILKEYARQDAPAYTVVVAEEQTEGRGRGEHTFFSPRGTGIYFSILLRYENRSFRPADITAAAGLAVSEAIEAISPKECKIKWMNDVYIDGKKVAGILAESGSCDGTGYSRGSFVVVGVGINVLTPEGGFPEEIRERAGAIFSEGMPPYAREKLVNGFVTSFRRILSRDSFSLYGAYRDRLFILSKRVSYQGREATVTELLPDFRLKLVFDDGSETLLDSGEVSLPQ